MIFYLTNNIYGLPLYYLKYFRSSVAIYIMIFSKYNNY